MHQEDAWYIDTDQGDAWTADQSDNAPDFDRDDNTIAFKCTKSAALNEQGKYFSLNKYDSTLRKMIETSIENPVMNDYISLDVTGQHIPLGYADYAPPNINPLDYNYYPLMGWRIAIPRVIPREQVQNILNSIFYYGPTPTGFVRIGDTMVPSILSPGDRMTLVQNY